MKPRILFLIVLFSIFTLNSRLFSNHVDLPLLPPHEGTSNGHIHELNVNHFLYEISKNDIEGYAEMINGSEFYSYPSLREDINVSMIARATTGQMGFEFLSGAVPENYENEKVSFFFLSDIDLNLNEPFDLFLEDEKILTFQSKEDGTLDILSNPGGGKVEFYLIKRDANNDGIGAFRITVPTSKVKKGAQARFRITGHRKGSNCWLMIFKAKDVVQRLRKSVAHEAAFMIKESEGQLHLDAPTYFSGKKIYVISDGERSSGTEFKKQGELAKATLQAKAPKNSLIIHFDEQVLEVKFPNGDGTVSTTDIQGEFLLHYSASVGAGWKASINKLFRPDFFDTYSNFFKKKYDKGVVSLMNSSHQDIAWVDRPEICIILRDTLLLTPVLKDASVRDDYGFDIEDGLILREYMQRHPDAKEKITELLNKKLLSVGATYNCPYEDMYDAEDQVRQLYLGKKWVKKTFGGYDSKVYWNVDVPGKTMQLPQILKKAGVDYMVISRHAKGMFNWESPDGSSVFTYSPGHYGNDLLYLDKDLNSKMKYGAQQVLYWEKNFSKDITTPLLSSQDMLPAIDYSEFISTWNGLKSVKDSKGKEKKVFLPDMELMTMDEFFPLAEKNADQIQTIRGERPNVWVYIHGPSHHDALTASRQASKLLPAAEKFLAVADVLDPVRMPYPFKEFDEAWQAKIYPDHGWGGHDGDITDELFKENFVKSRFMGEGLLNRGVGFIASQVQTNEKSGIPVVLFNSLSWERTDPVSIDLAMEKGKARGLTVVSAEGEEIVSQLSDMTYYPDGSIKSAQLTFVAESIPSIGYKTYYVKESDQPAKGTDLSTDKVTVYENEHYKLTFGRGGIDQVFDKELGKDLFDTKKFKVGEVFTMRSVGNGAGEFGDIQQPSMENFDQVGNYKPEWKIIENGEVYTKYRFRQQILHAIVQQDITVYHKLKRVLFNTELQNWSGEMFREFRTAFPLEMSDPQVAHEVPFGRVRVGIDEIKTAGERYTPLCKDVHPRAIIDWISSSDGSTEVTLSSSVAAADWIDPTLSNHTDDQVMLQHILLASRTSCHYNGNKYSQEGHHAYEHVLTSHKKGDMQGQRIAKQQNEPIQAVVYPTKAQGSSLPESLSFFSIDQENVMVTTVKKAEDNDNLILRMYDVVGRESTVKLNSHFQLDGMSRTNIIEEYPVSVPDLKIGKYAIETFSLEVAD